MYKIDVIRSLRHGWLTVDAFRFVHLFELIWIVFIKGFGAWLISTFIMVLLSFNGYSDLVIFYLFLLFSIIVGLIEALYDLRLKEIYIDNSETFRKSLETHLTNDNWWVRFCNKKYIGALKSYGKSDVYLYIIFDRNKAMVSIISGLPFPISTLTSKKMFNEIVKVGAS